MPLHYGGSISKTGLSSRKPRSGMKFSTQVKIEKVVQFDLAILAGLVLTDKEIGRVIGCSGFMVRCLRQKPEYLMLRMELTTGISVRAEDSVQTFVTLRKQAMVDMLPLAMRVVADTLMNPATPAALRAKMAVEVMDREGSHPKISRTDIHAKVEHDYANADGVSAELLSFMSQPGVTNEIDPLITKALEANRSFSNNETITASTQERAMKMLELIPEEGNTIQ